MEKEDLIKGLMRQVEDALHRKLTTPKDFDEACEKIERRTHERLSRTTLMRMWGYVREPVEPRLFTLSTLARFCGYSDWENFVEQFSCDGDQQSNPLAGDKIDVLENLHEDDVVTFTWQPGRLMKTRYLGNGRFEVIYSEKTRLRRGTTFLCFLVIRNEPLFVSQVTLDGTLIGAYACGKVNGVQFDVSPARETPQSPSQDA